jgi:hypothetical protein
LYKQQKRSTKTILIYVIQFLKTIWISSVHELLRAKREENIRTYLHFINSKTKPNISCHCCCYYFSPQIINKQFVNKSIASYIHNHGSLFFQNIIFYEHFPLYNTGSYFFTHFLWYNLFSQWTPAQSHCSLLTAAPFSSKCYACVHVNSKIG